MNGLLGNLITRVKTNKTLLWIVLTLLTLLTLIGPVLAEGATGSSI